MDSYLVGWACYNCNYDLCEMCMQVCVYYGPKLEEEKKIEEEKKKAESGLAEIVKLQEAHKNPAFQ